MVESHFDKLVSDLEAKLMEQAREVYSPEVIKHWEQPCNLGRLPSYNTCAKLTGQCGDSVEWFLEIEGEVIKNVSFLTDGCAGSIACNSVLSEMVKGKSLEEALSITPEDIIAALGGLPEKDKHCASLAIETLHTAIRNFWRK
ncbi:MAG: iron-sulfur cluster assembly scaffold protein [Candidatus Desulfofervidaceae bacterium]|nr:iron-sulfur cluster assembly scaffold protein [Candidatus Desulfofervidaceae bacterium]MDL1970252.1 iron-sulfur cluster assembly scaffold protein [Candidatus Desulfofervidaceae bacterium]